MRKPEPTGSNQPRTEPAQMHPHILRDPPVQSKPQTKERRSDQNEGNELLKMFMVEKKKCQLFFLSEGILRWPRHC